MYFGPEGSLLGDEATLPGQRDAYVSVHYSRGLSGDYKEDQLQLDCAIATLVIGSAPVMGARVSRVQWARYSTSTEWHQYPELASLADVPVSR